MGSTSDCTYGTKHTDTPHDIHPNGSITKPTILHLGDPILYNHALYSHLSSKYHIIHPHSSLLERSVFKKHLEDKTWGNFAATIRPFWNTGGEMGRWDRELIELLPSSMQVMASAGAGFDWVDTGVLAECGMHVHSFMHRADSCAIPDRMIVDVRRSGRRCLRRRGHPKHTHFILCNENGIRLIRVRHGHRHPLLQWRARLYGVRR